MRFVVAVAVGAFSGCGLGKVYIGEGGNLGATVARRATTGGGSTAGTTSTAGTSTTGTGAGTTAGNGPVVNISPDAPGCGRGQVAPTAVTPVHFLFTLDRSHSMNSAVDPAPSKWQALQAAMRAVFDQMGNDAVAGDASLAVGVDYFSEAVNNDPGSQDTVVELPLQALDRARADALMADISGRNARGYTPTEQALNVSYAAITAFVPGGALANGEKVVVLVSDGVPNPALSSPDVIRDLVAAMRTATPAVRTFAIGIGELSSGGYDPLFMSEIAAIGGGGRPGCDSASSDPDLFCHFQVTPSATTDIAGDLLAAFSSIRQQVRSCDLPLTIPDPTTLEPRAIAVVAEKDAVQRLILKDPANGWSFDDETHPTLVRLNGAECTNLKNDPGEKVFAVLGCTCVAGGTTGGSTAGTTTGSESPPVRQSESTTGGTTAGGDWNTNWCSYPFVPGNCTGESCR